MNETIKLSDLLFEISINRISRILTNMVGVSNLTVALLLLGVVAIVAFVLIIRFDPTIRYWFISRNEPLEPSPLLFNDDLDPITAQVLVGREGVVQAPLRPMGNVKLDGRTYVVKSEGIYIDPGTPVRVDRIEGPHIIVVPVMEEG
jgi:membrane-bound serine protease (ClpP class)